MKTKREHWVDVFLEKPKRKRHRLFNGKRVECIEYPCDPLALENMISDETHLPEEEWTIVNNA